MQMKNIFRKMQRWLKKKEKRKETDQKYNLERQYSQYHCSDHLLNFLCKPLWDYLIERSSSWVLSLYTCHEPHRRVVWLRNFYFVPSLLNSVVIESSVHCHLQFWTTSIGSNLQLFHSSSSLRYLHGFFCSWKIGKKLGVLLLNLHT